MRARRTPWTGFEINFVSLVEHRGASLCHSLPVDCWFLQFSELSCPQPDNVNTRWLWSKGKAAQLQARIGLRGSRKIKLSDFMTTAQGGGKVVSLTHLPPLPLGNTPGTHFC